MRKTYLFLRQINTPTKKWVFLAYWVYLGVLKAWSTDKFGG